MEENPFLSREELICVADKTFLLTKQSALTKMNNLLAKTEKDLVSLVKDTSYDFPEETFIKAGKISKGDNYLGLPYLMLDYPRLFGETNTFAFRTMFWWGNFFSCTLQISGDFLESRRSLILSRIDSLKQMGVYISINDDPWQYHLGDDNYLLLDSLGLRATKEIIENKKTIKVSRLLSLDEYHKLPDFASNTFQLFCRLVF